MVDDAVLHYYLMNNLFYLKTEDQGFIFFAFVYIDTITGSSGFVTLLELIPFLGPSFFRYGSYITEFTSSIVKAAFTFSLLRFESINIEVLFTT